MGMSQLSPQGQNCPIFLSVFHIQLVAVIFLSPVCVLISSELAWEQQSMPIANCLHDGGPMMYVSIAQH